MFSRKNPSPLGEQELKFLIPSHAAAGFRGWLNPTLRPHPRHAANTICSIYFDTPSLRSFGEKEASDHRKTKYRIRWYADASGAPLDTPAFVEIKEKQGSARRKGRVALHVPAAQIAEAPLTDPLFTRIFQRTLGGELTAILGDLRPMLELRYERRRFTHPVFSESFCLDSNIRCARSHPAWLPPAHGRPLDHAIFEQKGASAQPLPILQALPRFGARRASLSKYFLVMRHLQPDIEIE